MNDHRRLQSAVRGSSFPDGRIPFLRLRLMTAKNRAGDTNFLEFICLRYDLPKSTFCNDAPYATRFPAGP